jgi:hypothetical protein
MEKVVVGRTKKLYPNNDYSNALSDSHTADSRTALPSIHIIFKARFIFYPEDGDSKFFRNVGTIYQIHCVTYQNTVMSILSLL